MVEIITTEKFIETIIIGTQKPYRCSGYLKWHKSVDYELNIGKSIYSYACPICGFGEGGSINEKIAERLQKLQRDSLHSTYKGEK